jgi:pyrroloquinoline quinone (PQQ) biosynthesis protein C
MNDALNVVNTQLARASKPPDAEDQVTQIRGLIEHKNAALLEHAYFRRCRTDQISREQALNIVKHLYCFSVFFERLLARRITEYSSTKDPRILQLARNHMREEIGHAELFRGCLEKNGVSHAEIARLSPATFTRALFGYLTITIQHENEYVANVAIMQVMESIGYHFFAATLGLMQTHGMRADAMSEHTEDDVAHANLGVELVNLFDAATMRDCVRTVSDIYRLMSFVLDEWLDTNGADGLDGESLTMKTPRRAGLHAD